jgi:hypothetical protein
MSILALRASRHRSDLEKNGAGIRRSRQLLTDGLAESRRQFDEGMAAMRQEMAARDHVPDKRIGDLVSAIRDLIQRMDGRIEPR